MGTFGIIGGTFDPIHFGHLILAEKAREAFNLTKVVFVPAAVPPHKIGEVATPAEIRLQMVQLAVADNPCFEVSRVELDREGPSYTVDTIRQLKQQGHGDEAAFIMGFDSLLELHSWKNYRELLEEAKIITAFRPGYPILKNEAEWPKFLLPYRERILLLEAPLLEISSTWLRVEMMYGRSIRYLVPDPVCEFIRKYQLYGEV
ncbi:MAG TPA: nicotinate-nucleotide adenylyltransferase [Bacillota bacterium]|nr:nicotinate-nucleotide adenylyltransferase [Bacillota bacterium]